jgi:serine/threonine protein kinase
VESQVSDMNIQQHRLDRYELQQRLGYGGMAEVWKAFDTQLHRYVAIKLLHADLQSDPDFVGRFEREAQLIASLHHPNIVRIYDFRVTQNPETEETTAYMVMEYVVGQTLAHYLQATARAGNYLTSANLVQLFTPICLAVDYAHQQRMLHRDIKPSNILLDKRDPARLPMGEPILSDFGIARLLNTSAHTHSGWWLGTPLYMSPEQALGAAGDERSDIYSLSIILYEACTGTTPFRGNNPTAIIMQHIDAPRVPPALINPEISPALEEVILRGMARRPEERYDSASALGIALTEALNEPVPTALRQTAETFIAMSEPTSRGPASLPDALSEQPTSGPLIPLAGAASQPTSGPISTPPPLRNVELPRQTPIIPSGSTSPSRPSIPPVVPALPTPTAPAGSPITWSQPAPATHPVPISTGLQPAFPPNRWPRLRIAMSVLLILASLGALLFLILPRLILPSESATIPPDQRVVGHAFFLSSGQLDPTNSTGINDEVQLDLNGIPAPPDGKMYYAWLLGDQLQDEGSITALGPLTINHGASHLLYTGNASHTNLLASQSRILVTQEDASAPPSTYSPDYKSWLYYAKLPQAPSPADKLHFSMLDHLRHLLSESPELKARNLHGGLDMWFLRNTQKVLEWSTAARDDWRRNPDLQHRQFIRILDFLEGNAFVRADEPQAWPVVYVDPHDSQVGLVGPVPDGKDPPGYTFDDEPAPGYVYLISSHLAGTVLSPDATAEQRALAARIHTAIDETRVWLEKAHQDAKQLVAMNSKQLTQPHALALLDDLVTQAQQAYVGQPDPISGQQMSGAIWICNNIQRMANFEIKPFSHL